MPRDKGLSTRVPQCGCGRTQSYSILSSQAPKTLMLDLAQEDSESPRLLNGQAAQLGCLSGLVPQCPGLSDGNSTILQEQG